MPADARVGTAIVLRARDVLSGIFLLAVGLGSFWLAQGYRMGTAAAMGPGYVPRALAVLLMLIGAGIAVRAALSGGEPAARPALWPLVFVTAAIVAFGALIERAGLIVATATLVALGAVAARDYRPVETTSLIVGLAAFAVVVFRLVLGLPLPVWFP